MVLDPSAYIAGLNRAAQHTAAFQNSIQAGTAGINAFAKASQSMAVGMSRLNGSVYASMTAFYALSRVVSSSLGVFEEYNNIIARISATADLSISSVTALSESFKKLNRELGGSRIDLMKGVYRAVQANFTTPEEFMPIGAAAMRLRTASGREIDTTKSADVISVIRNALGIKSGREGFITDMLLRGRDIGRYELTEMASALGIPITLFGNQFSAKLGPEETLRQLIAILSSATQTGLNPRTAATGTRRMVEKTTRLMKYPEGIGKNLTTALRSMGFSSISEALNQGPMAFLETISRLTGGSPEALTQMGYGSRDIMLLTSALRNNMGQTREFYSKLAPGEIGGTTDKYLDRHKQTWWYQRDRLRSAYLDSQLKLMEAMIPVMSSFANSLEVVNDLFQALAPSIKRLIGLMTIGAGFSILRNFYVRSTGGKFGAQGSDNLMKNLPVMGVGTPRTADYYGLRRVIVPNKYVPPVKSPIGNQIYSGFGNIFRIAHPSYYGGGISSVGWRPLDSNNAQGQLIPIIPTPQKIMPYNIQNLNRKYNSAFMNPNAKHLNRVQIKSKSFSVKAEQQRAIDLYNWNLQREALIAQNRARSSYLRNAYGPNRVLGQATREMQEQWMWGNQRRADGRPMYTRAPDKKYRLPPMQSSMGMNKDWSSGRSFVGQAIREGYHRMKNNFYDYAFRFLGRASDNVQRFSEGYGKAKGWLKDSWLGKGGAFAFGGNEYRLNRIQKMYDARIEAANKAFVSGKAGADRGADWMRDIARQSGVNPMAASRIAAQHFNSTMEQVTKNFNKATASAANTAKWMSRVSGVMGTIGSVANMAAIGGIFSLVASFIEGLKGTGNFTKMVGGKIDMNSLVGRKTGLHDPLDVFQKSKQGMRMLGYGIGGLFGNSDWRQNIFDDMEKYNRARGYVLDENTGKFKKATYQDIVERTLRENFSPKESRELRFAGYDKFTPENQREFEKWLGSKEGGGYTGGLPMDLLQSATTINGMPANEWFQEKISGFMRSQEVQSKVIEVTTKRIAEMGKAAEEAGKRITFASREYTVGFEHMGKLRDKTAPNKFAVEEFWRDAKKKGAFPDMEAYNSRILDFYNNAGIMPDDYTGRGSKMFKGERPSAFIDRLLSDPSDVLFKNKTAMLGGSQDDMFNKRNALKVLEVLPMLVGANDSELSAMVQNIFGTSSAQNPFFEQAKNMFAMLDPSEFLGLIKVGEQFSAPVQKYSEALGYGTSEGYNAMLPYWADKEDKNEIFVKNWEGLLKFVEEMDKKLSNIEVATQETVTAVYESGE